MVIEISALVTHVAAVVIGHGLLVGAPKLYEKGKSYLSKQKAILHKQRVKASYDNYLEKRLRLQPNQVTARVTSLDIKAYAALLNQDIEKLQLYTLALPKPKD